MLYGQSVVTGSEVPLLLWPEWGPSGNVFEAFVTRTDDFLHPPTWLVRRELFESAGFFDESKAGWSTDMALRIAARTPWMFLSGGPVARGRYSQQGLWYSTIANGTNEQQLPRIIESALAGLPVTVEGDRVRRKARAAVCASIAHQRWWAGGGLEPTRTYLLTSMRAAPWLLQEAAVMEWVNRIAVALAESSNQPIRAVKAFWHEIREATAGGAATHTVSLRRLLGEMLAAAAISMRRGSPETGSFRGGQRHPQRSQLLGAARSASPIVSGVVHTSMSPRRGPGTLPSRSACPSEAVGFQGEHETQYRHSLS